MHYSSSKVKVSTDEVHLVFMNPNSNNHLQKTEGSRSFGCFNNFKSGSTQAVLRNIIIICCCYLMHQMVASLGLNSVFFVFNDLTAKPPVFQNLAELELTALLCQLMYSFISLSFLERHSNILRGSQGQDALHYCHVPSCCYHFGQNCQS